MRQPIYKNKTKVREPHLSGSESDMYTVHVRSKICPCVPPRTREVSDKQPGFLAFIFLSNNFSEKKRDLKSVSQCQCPFNLIHNFLKSYLPLKEKVKKKKKYLLYVLYNKKKFINHKQVCYNKKGLSTINKFVIIKRVYQP